MDEIATWLQVIRDGVIVEMPGHPISGLAQHLSFPHHASGSARPVREFVQTLVHFLATRAAFHFEVPFLVLSAVMRKSQKGELLRFLASLVRTLTSKASELEASCFLRCQLQPKSVEPF
jgi:hypothetical protein